MSKRKISDDFIDDGPIDQLSGILTSDNVNQDVLLAFLDKGLYRQVLQIWSYYGQVSDHDKLEATTIIVDKLFEFMDKNTSFMKYGVDIIRLITEEYMKVIYRCLFLMKLEITGPMLNIMRQITAFNRGMLVPDFFAAFDFSIKIIPKLLSSNNGGLRKKFLQFYLSFIQNGTYPIRKDLISQKKVISGWFKNMSELDDEEMILESLNVFMNCILKESAFLKSTKLSFFNDWITRQLVKLFLHKSSAVRSKTAEFFELLTTSRSYGLAFAESGWSDKEINNRALLTIAKLLKPWEDIDQQDLLIKMLGSCSELVSPYISDLMETISFDPKISSFWVSLITLLSRICLLPVSEEQLLLFETPPDQVVLNNTLPFKKSAISKALSHQSPMIVYFGCQLLIFGLRRFRKVREVYGAHGWDFRSLLIEANSSRLPHSQVFTSIVSTAGNDKPLLKTVVLSTLREYLYLYGEESVPISLPPTRDWTASNVTGLNYVEIQISLEIQMKISAGEKWWKKPAQNQEYSLFTSALRLAASNQDFAEQVIKLLQRISLATLLFQEVTLVHPIEILVNTVIQAEGSAPLLKLIEESVSRCMLSPYKYVDKFAEMRSNENAVISPLLITLMEQLEYASDYDTAEKWVIKLLRDCCVCGEDRESMIRLAKHYNLKRADLLVEENMKKWNSLYPVHDYFDYILVSKESDILNRKDLSYKMGMKMDLEATKYRVLRSTVKLTDHLLKSIPLENVEFQKMLVDPRFFSDLLLKGEECAAIYLEKVRTLNRTDELGEFLKKNDMVSLAFWTQDNESLVSLAQLSAAHAEACLPELAKRRARVSLVDIARTSDLLDEATEKMLVKVIKNNNYQSENAKSLADCEKKMIKNGHITALCALIEASRRLESDLDVSAVSDQSLVQLTVALIKYAPQKLDLIDISRAFDVGICLSTLPLYDIERLESNRQLSIEVSDFISNLPAKDILSLDVVHTVGLLYALDNESLPVRKWFSQCILWLTKTFTEQKSGQISSDLSELLRAVDNEFRTLNIWKVVGKKAVNAWLESSINCLNNDDISRIVTRVAFWARQSHENIDHTKLLQLILNYEDYSGNKHALLIWTLFHCDARQNIGIQEKLLTRFFEASPDPNDWLILDVLQSIERLTETSWANSVISWSIRDDEADELILASHEGLEVVLNRKKIMQSVKSLKPEEWFELKQDVHFDDALSEIEKHRKIYIGSEKRYNPAFLLLSIISSDLFEKDELDIRRLVDSHALAFAVANLGSLRLAPIAKLIIQSLAQSDMSKFKDRVAIGLLSKKLMTFLDKQDASTENNKKTAPCIYVMLALLINVITSPGHFLYNSASQFLLSGPSIKQELIPLYDSISKTDSEMARREISWLLNSLTISLQTNEDIKLYLKRGVFEWALSLPEKLFGSEQTKLVAKAQETPGGAFRLAAGTGGICWSEMRQDLKEKLRYIVAVPDKLTAWSGVSPVYM